MGLQMNGESSETEDSLIGPVKAANSIDDLDLCIKKHERGWEEDIPILRKIEDFE